MLEFLEIVDSDKIQWQVERKIMLHFFKQKRFQSKIFLSPFAMHDVLYISYIIQKYFISNNDSVQETMAIFKYVMLCYVIFK